MNNYNFELIEYNNFQSARIFITSIQYSNFHWHPEYEFNEDFTQVWRKESYEQREMEARRRNLCARKRG